MRLTEAIKALLDATAADGRSARTIESYRKNLGYFADFLGDVEIGQVTIKDLRSYAAHLRTKTERYAGHPSSHVKEGGLSPASVACYLRPVRRLFRWLMDEELITKDPSTKLKIQDSRRTEPKAISLDDMRALLAAAAGNDAANLRDTALLFFLADTGARAGGVTHVKLQDLQFNGKPFVRLTEKGKKTRIVPLSLSTTKAINAWLSVRPGGDASGDWLFINLGGVAKGPRLTEDGLGEILRRLKRKAGVTGPVNPHSFRHAFAREWLRSGGDLASLARILGHADASVALRSYAVFADNELQPFHAKFSPVSQLSDEP